MTKHDATFLLLLGIGRLKAKAGIRHCLETPVAPAKQIVNFIGDDQLLERDFLGAQFFDEIGGLLERQHGERLQF